MTAKEKVILRELAKEYAQVAALDVQKEHRARGQAINDLKVQRPVVLLDEIPWHEMDINGELTLLCEDDFAKQMERFFRRRLFQWKYFPGDMVVEPFFPIGKTVHSTGIGLQVQENVVRSDAANHIVSHEYIDQLSTQEDLDKVQMPVITGDAQADAERCEKASDVLGEILPVRLRGHYIYYAPWDQIPRYRGVTPILYDMADRPEFVHQIIEKFTQIGLSTVQQYEQQGLLDYDIETLHCTPPYTADLPAADFNGQQVRMKDTWIRGMAQMFSSVSPEMWKEFELDYSNRLFEKFGLVYYGCCEPLDNKIDLLKQIPNLRKIGVSPWANVESSAEQIGGDYVYARKPNPALVAMKTDVEQVRREIAQTAEVCLRYGCPCEFVLKDISTVSYRPENLIVWEKTVRETLDAYYG